MTDFCLGLQARERIARQAGLMGRMLAWLGVEREACLAGDAATQWSQARLACVDCKWSGRCGSFLAAPPRASPRHAPDFCVNARFFQHCTADEAATPNNEEFRHESSI